MKETFQTVYEGCTGEVTIKKSRFIATVQPAETEEEAAAFLEGVKKKYWNASHNCYAYVIGTDPALTRCSDDGEPSKTAGMPILDVLLTHGLTDIIVVVTRYFGGTLLGTGGLVKAYQSAVLEALKHSVTITKELGRRISLTADYDRLGRLQAYLSQEQLTLLSTSYTELVELEVLVPPVKYSAFSKKIAELTNGSAILKDLGQVYFTHLNGEVLVF